MIQYLLLALCTSACLQGMDTAQPDYLSALPQELTYQIIEKWPALNLYRLVCKQLHQLTSYAHADTIVHHGGTTLIRDHDRKQLLYSFIKEGKTELISLLLHNIP